MHHTRFFLGVFVVLATLSSPSLSITSVPPPNASAARVPGCGGCAGAGGSGSASGGTCGGMVSISVTMKSGTCKWFATEEPLNYVCSQTKSCTPSVTRTWSGLPANSALKFCVTTYGETLCLANPPTAGVTGSGEDPNRVSAPMSCLDDVMRTFSIESPGCGLVAEAQATCSACNSSL